MPEDLAAGQVKPFRVWNRGAVRPVLALHCSLAHSGAWSGLVERLSGVTVTALDQPGHGRAADWDGRDETHALTTRLSAEMADRLCGGGPVDLFGHSFGATVALRIALTRPDLIRSLVLVEPVIFAAAKADPAYAPFRAEHETVARLLAAGRREEAAALFHAGWGTGEAFADLPDRQRSYILARIHHIGAQNPVLLDDAAGLLTPGGLEAIRVPVLMIEGGNSPAIIGAVQGALCARLPIVTRLIVPEAGHMVPITHPDVVARAVQAHLDAT
jgi:lipase